MTLQTVVLFPPKNVSFAIPVNKLKLSQAQSIEHYNI